ncbi:MAG: hypothetical protein IJX75_00020 [Clostridia bacterium]|nr:hypothetical protein [Clostridia bacterium]
MSVRRPLKFRLKELLEKNNETVESLSQALNITEGDLLDWSNHKKDPTLRGTIQIARRFNCSVDYLLEFAEYPSKKEELAVLEQKTKICEEQSQKIEEQAQEIKERETKIEELKKEVAEYKEKLENPCYTLPLNLWVWENLGKFFLSVFIPFIVGSLLSLIIFLF